MILKGLFAVHIFVSAFLIFFVQPMVAKVLQPLYGSSAFVWIACMLFFQTGLFLGYGYAFVLSRQAQLRWQCLIHSVLVVGCLYFLPLVLTPESWAQHAWPPLQVLAILISSLLLPFAILCATSPLIQHWYCQVRPSKHPYGYYAVSNAGSLIGLFCYPLIVELFMPLPKQVVSWSLGFGLFVIMSIVCTAYLLKASIYKPIEEPEHGVQSKHWSLWLLLSFLGSTILTSGTYFITQNMLNIPLIWILPLALYLISFIVTFSKPKGYEKSFWLHMYLVWTVLFSYLLYRNDLSNMDTLVILLVLMYSGMMVCHGEIAQLKPREDKLTFFYLIIALGGMLGGLFVNLIAPFIFTQWWDLLLPLFIVLAISVYLLGERNKHEPSSWHVSSYLLSVLILFVYSFVLFSLHMDIDDERLMAVRNPYGLIQTFEVQTKDGDTIRQLTHGAVVHGIQFQAPQKQQWATTYYSEQSGVGAIIDYLHQSKKNLNIAVLGLGTGTISALSKQGDSIDYYEIDPDIIDISQQYFSFLQQGAAAFKLIKGDARLTLSNSHQDKPYDLIIVDAFSGDNIPFHLITTQAMNLYLNKLSEDGAIAFHISNAFIDLSPVTFGLAKHFGLNHLVFMNRANLTKAIFQSKWSVVTTNKGFKPFIQQSNFGLLANPMHTVLWSDEKNSVLSLLHVPNR